MKKFVHQEPHCSNPLSVFEVDHSTDDEISFRNTRRSTRSVKDPCGSTTITKPALKPRRRMYQKKNLSTSAISNDEDSAICGNCNQLFEVNDISVIGCDFCHSWLHLKCTELDEATLNFLKETPFKSSILYKCATCQQTPNDLDIKNTVKEQGESVKKVQERISNLEDVFASRFDKLENILTNNVQTENKVFHKTFKDALATNLEKQFANNKTITAINNNLCSFKKNNQIISTISEDLSSVKKRIETKFTNEIETKSKKKRINNVCIFNVPEPNSEDEEINYKQDIQNLRKIFENKVQLQMEDLTDVVRLPPNKTKAKSTNPRPIIMKFKTIEKRNEILQSRNLILVENDITHNIYVQPERTKREQEEHKLLVTT